MNDGTNADDAVTGATKEQLEIALLVVQKEKVLAEISVLRRTTPLTEAIKVIGSMVLGVGGAIAAVAGFQLAEVRAEKLKIEAESAVKARDAAAEARKSLVSTNEELQRQSDDLRQKVEGAKAEYAQISDRLAAAEKQAANPAVSMELRDLQQTVNAADINLRAATPRRNAVSSGASLDVLVERLFAPTASVRGAAYEELLGRYSAEPELVPKLITFSESHFDNSNGVYNALVALSRLDHKALNSDLASIRSFASKAKAIGPKTAERAEKLLDRLPKA